MQDAQQAADRYRDVLIARGDTPTHAYTTHQRISRLLGIMSRSLADLRTSDVQLAIGRLKTPPIAAIRGLSHTSCNHYLRAIKSFLKWATEEEGLTIASARAIIRNIRPYRAATDIRHQRRAMSFDEFRALVRAAKEGPTVRRMSGPDRGLLYELATYSGLRANELRQLTVGMIQTAGEQPAIDLPAVASKNRKAARQPLPWYLAPTLKSRLAGRPPAERIFPTMPQPSRVVHMLRKDLTAAGVAYETVAGFVDFHSLRHTYITWLAARTPDINVVRRLARHSTVNLTIRYTHTTDAGLADAVGLLPSMGLADGHELGRAGVEPATHGFSVRSWTDNPQTCPTPTDPQIANVAQQIVGGNGIPDAPPRALPAAG